MEIRFCPSCGTPVQHRLVCGRTRPACPACGFVHFPNPRVAVAMFLAEGDRILLVKRGVAPERGRWALAAGFVDLGESPEAAARREMREETGLEVEIDRLLDLSYEEGQRVILILYRVRLLGGTLAANDDAEAAQWFTRDDLPELAFESTRRMVEAWLGAT